MALLPSLTPSTILPKAFQLLPPENILPDDDGKNEDHDGDDGDDGDADNDDGDDENLKLPASLLGTKANNFSPSLTTPLFILIIIIIVVVVVVIGVLW